jgi:lysophospholipase L1-like esterase
MALGLAISRLALSASPLAGATGGVPAPIPTTSNFTFTQIGSGWGGSTDSTTNAARLGLVSSIDTRNGSLWYGVITGTDAFIRMARSSGASQTNMIEVSVDGGAFAAPVYDGVADEFPLFVGLAQGAHVVQIRVGSAYANAVYMAKTGNVLRVVGVNPAVSVPSSWKNPGDANTVTSAGLSANTANYVPAFRPATAPLQNFATVALRHSQSEMLVVTASRYVWVAVDQSTTPTRHEVSPPGATPTKTRAVRIVGLPAGSHRYTIWTATPQSDNSSRFMAVALFSGAFEALGAAIRVLDQFGDSITEGQRGNTDTMKVAPALNMIGNNGGVSGNTVEDLLARIDAYLATLAVGPAAAYRRVAVIAVGRNNTASWSAATTTAYTDLVNKILATGLYDRILCRGVLSEASIAASIAAINGNIQGVVASINNPIVKFADTLPWTSNGNTIDRPDLVHPNDNGYDQMVTYEQSATYGYPAFL